TSPPASPALYLPGALSACSPLSGSVAPCLCRCVDSGRSFSLALIGHNGLRLMSARRVIRRRLCWAVMRIPGCRDCTTWRQEEPMTPDDQPVGLSPETAVILARRPGQDANGPL